MSAVSVVVPTFNRWDGLEMTLRALGDQTVSRSDLEIVVVSDGSTDGTDEHLTAGRSPVPVTFVAQSNQGPAAARNAGVAASHGDLIVFIDDDVVAEPGCIAAHLAAHERAQDPTVVIGPLLTPESVHLNPWVMWEQTALSRQYDAMKRGDWAPTARQFYTGNASLPRTWFTASGGFDRSFRRAEDVELAYRLSDLGLAFAFEIEARAFHHAERSYDAWLANARAYGANDVVFWRDGGQEWLLPAIRAEYRRRHPLNRAFTRLGLAVPAVGRLTARVAPRWAELIDRLGMAGAGRRTLSAQYNLEYYRSLTDELGGVDRFLAIQSAFHTGRVA